MSQELFKTRDLLNKLLELYPQHGEYLESALSEVNKIIDIETDRIAKILKDGKVPGSIADHLNSFLMIKGYHSFFPIQAYRQDLEVLTKIGIIEESKLMSGHYFLKDETTARELLQKYRKDNNLRKIT